MVRTLGRVHAVHQSVWGAHGRALGAPLSHLTVQLERPWARRSAFLPPAASYTDTWAAQVPRPRRAPAYRLGCCCLTVPPSALRTLLSTWWAFSSQTPCWPGLKSIQNRDPEAVPSGKVPQASAGSYPRSRSPERPLPAEHLPAELGSAWPSCLSCRATWLSLFGHNLCRLVKHWVVYVT